MKSGQGYADGQNMDMGRIKPFREKKCNGSANLMPPWLMG